ncbi:hypothetical protein BJ684DRAFT_16252 [Piptocephalis cylindrospora]|uniref:Uncharacterized protein n=1 Tax=Piptocephalis cylindrospora TaxID=1907219 RepID=A0A4P9Y3A4_9FUNG|nr:hypothetical protein BJ684DRAFT_16252 [Piptocephalis cylindrospora]|eukprot:RKP13345.1 hypothetical protein BJ684DRAFT_16252 [Piptocephalis cylindrospora]
MHFFTFILPLLLTISLSFLSLRQSSPVPDQQHVPAQPIREMPISKSLKQVNHPTTPSQIHLNSLKRHHASPSASRPPSTSQRHLTRSPSVVHRESLSSLSSDRKVVTRALSEVLNRLHKSEKEKHLPFRLLTREQIHFVAEQSFKDISGTHEKTVLEKELVKFMSDHHKQDIPRTHWDEIVRILTHNAKSVYERPGEQRSSASLRPSGASQRSGGQRSSASLRPFSASQRSSASKFALRDQRGPLSGGGGSLRRSQSTASSALNVPSMSSLSSLSSSSSSYLMGDEEDGEERGGYGPDGKSKKGFFGRLWKGVRGIGKGKGKDMDLDPISSRSQRSGSGSRSGSSTSLGVYYDKDMDGSMNLDADDVIESKGMWEKFKGKFRWGGQKAKRYQDIWATEDPTVTDDSKTQRQGNQHQGIEALANIAASLGQTAMTEARKRQRNQRKSSSSSSKYNDDDDEYSSKKSKYSDDDDDEIGSGRSKKDDDDDGWDSGKGSSLEGGNDGKGVNESGADDDPYDSMSNHDDHVGLDRSNGGDYSSRTDNESKASEVSSTTTHAHDPAHTPTPTANANDTSIATPSASSSLGHKLAYTPVDDPSHQSAAKPSSFRPHIKGPGLHASNL